MKICSACLLGLKTRYDGKSKPHQKIINLSEKEALIPVCPEQLGGLPTPREPSEATKDGREIIEGKGKVISKSNKDLTSNFIKGAKQTLKICETYNIKTAILKQKSASCGNGIIYDGTFTNTTTKGDGVTTALLKKEGIKVTSEKEVK